MKAALLLLVVILLVHGLVGLAARPMGDDWCEWSYAAERGPVGATLYWYATWSGRYTTFGLKSTLYSVFGLAAPSLVPLLLLVGNWGVWTFALHPRLRHAGLVSAAVIYGVVTAMPNPFQGLYYASASLLYVAPLMLVGLLVASVLHRWPWGITAALAFLIGGTNEPLALLVLVGLSGTVLCTRRLVLAPALLALVVGLALTYVAPGNAERAALEPMRFTPDILRLAFEALRDDLAALVTTQPLALIVPLTAGLVIGQRDHRLLARIPIWGLVVATLTVSWLVLLPVAGTLGRLPARSLTLPLTLISATACVVGLKLGSQRHYDPSVLTPVVVAALLMAIGWTLRDAPHLMADAVAFDRGIVTDIPTDRAQVVANSVNYARSCRQGDTEPLYIFYPWK